MPPDIPHASLFPWRVAAESPPRDASSELPSCSSPPGCIPPVYLSRVTGNLFVFVSSRYSAHGCPPLKTAFYEHAGRERSNLFTLTVPWPFKTVNEYPPVRSLSCPSFRAHLQVPFFFNLTNRRPTRFGFRSRTKNLFPLVSRVRRISPPLNFHVSAFFLFTNGGRYSSCSLRYFSRPAPNGRFSFESAPKKFFLLPSRLSSPSFCPHRTLTDLSDNSSLSLPFFPFFSTPPPSKFPSLDPVLLTQFFCIDVLLSPLSYLEKNSDDLTTLDRSDAPAGSIDPPFPPPRCYQLHKPPFEHPRPTFNLTGDFHPS